MRDPRVDPRPGDDEPPMLPTSCGYQGYEFGAGRYPDSQCFGGRLYDMDNCDDNGIYEPMDDIPCPMCHPKAAVAYYKSQNLLSMPRRNSRGDPRRYSKRDCARMARRLVNNIRQNRKYAEDAIRRAILRRERKRKEQQ